MKLLIIGHKGSGKTHIGEILADRLETEYRDSSGYCFKHVVYPVLKEKYGYKNEQEAMEDKDNRRSDWFNLISEYNAIPDRLTKEILSEGDIYVGMRNRREFEGSKHHFDLRIWVDARARVEDESIESMELTSEDSQYILDNNGSKKSLLIEIDRLMYYLEGMKH